MKGGGRDRRRTRQVDGRRDRWEEGEASEKRGVEVSKEGRQVKQVQEGEKAAEETGG